MAIDPHISSDPESAHAAPVPPTSVGGSPSTPDTLAMIKTKLPERTVRLLDELLGQQGLTRYEFVQMCVMLYLSFARSDQAWTATTEEFRHPFLQAFSHLMDTARTNREFIRTFRQLEGMQDIKQYDLADRIESVVTPFKGGATVTMQNPGLFEEFSYSANDALDSILSHIPPLTQVMREIREHYPPDKTTTDIVLTALADHLTDLRGHPQGHYAQNEYGRTPVRHWSVKPKQ